jgi:hypothetical protein
MQAKHSEATDACCRFPQLLSHEGLPVLAWIRNGSLRKKYDALKYTLKKMENTLYELSLTESGVFKPQDFPASAIEVQARIWVCPD